MDPKRAAAEAAVALVESGMIVGLGSGSTAALAVSALAARGLDIKGVPTSEETARLAHQAGIALLSIDQVSRIDLTIDGADEIERGTLNLIKGRGGALTREKIVAAASDRLVIVADESKLVDRLGEKMPLPIEVLPFGWRSTAERLRALGGDPERRDFITDNGNYILDCRFKQMPDAAALDGVIGVVEHGLFIGMADTVFVGATQFTRI